MTQADNTPQRTPTIADLFDPPVTPAGAQSSREAAWSQYQAARRQVASFSNRRTRRAMAAAVQAAEVALATGQPAQTARRITLDDEDDEVPKELAVPFFVDWYNAESWTTPQGNYPILTMLDQHLWETLIWCVRNVETLYPVYNTQMAETMLLSLASRKWLALQTAFRAMLQEALRRQLTFPTDVHDYVRRYVLQRDGQLDNYTPWRDQAALAAQADMRGFLEEPVDATIETDYGREARVIDLQ